MELTADISIFKNLENDKVKFLFLFEQLVGMNSHKLIFDQDLKILDELSDRRSQLIIGMMSRLRPKSIKRSSIKLEDEYSIINIANTTKSKVILTNNINPYVSKLDELYKSRIRLLSWAEIMGELKLRQVNSIQNLVFVEEEIKLLNNELSKYLSVNPNVIKSLHHRTFELFISDLLRNYDFETIITPQTRDGGKDIIAKKNIPLVGDILFHIECKKYHDKYKIGIDILERFLFNIRDKEKVNCGLIFTTSKFSKDSFKLSKSYKSQLKLYDIDKIQEFLNYTGEWAPGNNSCWMRSIED